MEGRRRGGERPGGGVGKEKGRWRVGVDSLGGDATFSWSRALTHPPRCILTRHREVEVEWWPSRIGHRDVIGARKGPILLMS